MTDLNRLSLTLLKYCVKSSNSGDVLEGISLAGIGVAGKIRWCPPQRKSENGGWHGGTREDVRKAKMIQDVLEHNYHYLSKYVFAKT